MKVDVAILQGFFNENISTSSFMGQVPSTLTTFLHLKPQVSTAKKGPCWSRRKRDEAARYRIEDAVGIVYYFIYNKTICKQILE